MLKRLLPLLAVLLWAEAAAATDQANLRYLRISTGYAAGSSFRVGMAIACLSHIPHQITASPQRLVILPRALIYRHNRGQRGQR